MSYGLLVAWIDAFAPGSVVANAVRLLSIPAIVFARRGSASGFLADVLSPLAAAFGEAGHELYLVGGSVRDAVLGRLGTDLDFTTDARPETVREILDRYAPADLEAGEPDPVEPSATDPDPTDDTRSTP